MGNFIENRSIACMYCRYSPVQGRETTYEDRRGIVTECRWICPQCGQVSRCDESIQPKAKKEEPKKQETKQINEKTK